MTQRKKGAIQVFIWAVLILAGIVSKRVYDHPDWMMLFHGPAAIFLVLGMRNLSVEFRARYQMEINFKKRDLKKSPSHSGILG
jgi:hypothetical protein